ncbi:MAG TPA: M20/M25/M40 family metallo-hydrolase [Tepidisphaeraceae bacterium]|nr:M20/M25/M40 family metallo-hydrolase [Tepidisphaeraceae bacterium]
MPRAFVHLILLLALAALALYQAFPAAPRAPQSAADFDTTRALAHVRAIAKEPHPAGSPANDAARAYILAELAKLDLQPVVITRTIRWYAPTPTLTLHNILVRIPGRRATPATDPPLPTARANIPHAILLTAHYDSVATAPGAADDAAGVAALLETASALRAAPPLDRDVYLLLTDGEEGGLRGARAVAGNSSHITVPSTAPDAPWDAPPDQPLPLFSHVALILNFEARGTSGPSVMFETGPAENLALLRHFAAADPSPVATSLAFDVYRILPNNTDFTVFKKLGLQGLNFSFIGSFHNYHTKNDSPDNLSHASLHHHGQHALALARHFASLDDASLATVLSPNQPGSVFFSPTRNVLVVYPSTWIWPLTALQTLLTLTVIVIAARKRQLSGRGLASAAVRFLLSILLSAAAIFGLITWLGPMRSTHQFHPYLAATSALAALVTLFVALEFRRGARRRTDAIADAPPLAASHRPTTETAPPTSISTSPTLVTTQSALTTVPLIFATLLSIPANLYLPGGSYLLTLPAISASLALLAALTLRRPWLRTAAQLLAIAPTLFIVVPMLYLLNQALLPTKLYYGGYDPTRFLDTPIIAAGLSILTVQLVWKLIPALTLRTSTPIPHPALAVQGRT